MIRVDSALEVYQLPVVVIPKKNMLNAFSTFLKFGNPYECIFSLPLCSFTGNMSMGLQKGKFVKNPNAPDDRFYFILITISLFSLVQMLPFLFFSTANEVGTLC